MNRVVVPGRVNLIGDHTDYTGGLVLPMAIDRHTTIGFVPVDGPTELTSDDTGDPGWLRYPDAVAAEMREAGLAVRAVRGHVTTTIPVGAGLSSSAALEIAAALAFGFEGHAEQLALLTQRAEHRATGVPTGIMDQLCIASARAGHATLIDCRSLAVAHVEVPGDVTFVVRFVAHRTLEGSGYAERVAECAAAEREIGPLRDASVGDVAAIGNDTLRRRARHVVTENERVMAFAGAMGSGDFVAAGGLMTASHRSLDADYGVSTPAMNDAVEDLLATPGVLGARMTGGGFGGCVVAMCRPGTNVAGWGVAPTAGPSVGK
ncbi:MAG: galactokinase [Acidimicrobiales bacterium]